jgi:hypothetical protein
VAVGGGNRERLKGDEGLSGGCCRSIELLVLRSPPSSSPQDRDLLGLPFKSFPSVI